MPHRLSEEATRKEMIDPQLEKAGWYLRDHSKVKIEIPEHAYDAEPWNGISDYTLCRENGEILAVIEAKDTVIDARLASLRDLQSGSREELSALMQGIPDKAFKGEL